MTSRLDELQERRETLLKKREALQNELALVGAELARERRREAIIHKPNGQRWPLKARTLNVLRSANIIQGKMADPDIAQALTRLRRVDFLGLPGCGLRIVEEIEIWLEQFNMTLADR